MYTIISEAQPLCDGMYLGDVLQEENGDIFFAVEVTIEGTRKVFLVYISDLVEFFNLGVDYNHMNEQSTHTFDTYEQFCKWCSYNLKS